MTDSSEMIAQAIARHAMAKAKEKLYTYDEVLEIVDMILTERSQELAESTQRAEQRRKYRNRYIDVPPRKGSARMKVLVALYNYQGDEGGEMSRKDLIAASGIQHSTLIPRLSELERGGYITKQYGSDGAVALTEMGASHVESSYGG